MYCKSKPFEDGLCRKYDCRHIVAMPIPLVQLRPLVLMGMAPCELNRVLSFLGLFWLGVLILVEGQLFCLQQLGVSTVGMLIDRGKVS